MGFRQVVGNALTKAGMMMAGPWGGGGSVGNGPIQIGSGGFVQALTPPGGAPPRRRGEDYLRSFATQPWLRAVVHKVSFSCATIPWKLYLKPAKSGDEPVEYEKPHPLRDLLTNGVRDPGGVSVLTGLQMRMLTHEYMELRGEAFWLLDRNVGGKGVPVQAWPCPPNWIVRSPTQDDPTFWLTMPHGMQAKVPASEVVWFRDPDPYNPYTRGVGIAESLGEELSIDEFAAKHVSRFFWNSARPDLIVSKTGLNEPGLRRLEEEWNRRNQGVWNAFRAYFLSGDADIKVLDRDFQKLQFTQLRQWERDIIFQTFGIPPEIMGLLDKSNRATIQIADFIFAKYVISPRLALFDSTLNARVTPEYDKRLMIEHDDPVPENREAAIKEVLDANAGQIMTQNERRKKLGLEEIAGGDSFLVPVNLSPVTTLGAATHGEEVAPGTLEEPGQTIEDVPTEGPEIALGRSVQPRLKASTTKADDDSTVELDVVLGDMVQEAKRMFEQLRPVYRHVLVDHGNRALDGVGVGPLDESTARIVRYLEYTAPKRIKGITDTTWQNLRESLGEGITAGETIPQLADRVSAVFGDAKGARAELIARTETVDASNEGALEGYRQSEVVEQKEWLTAQDDKVCPICDDLDGEIVDLDEDFSSGDDAPGAHPDCRCTILPVLTEKAVSLHRTAQWKVYVAAQEAQERMFVRDLKRAMQEQQNRVMDRLRGARTVRAIRAGAKVSKAEAAYVDDYSGSQPCSKCSMFRAPHGCTAVFGKIAASGHCKLWEAAKAARSKELAHV